MGFHSLSVKNCDSHDSISALGLGIAVLERCVLGSYPVSRSVFRADLVSLFLAFD